MLKRRLEGIWDMIDKLKLIVSQALKYCPLEHCISVINPDIQKDYSLRKINECSN
jgi:hypothetical protein